jgi:hypothetical protein
MTTITLGFKAFDPHELLCHFVADMAGLYRRESLQVELADITFIPIPNSPRTISRPVVALRSTAP